MAQVKGNEHFLGKLEPVCLLCQEKKPYDIFWAWAADRSFYVCKNCESIIKALYKDIVFQESEDKGITIDEIVKEDLQKMHEIVKMRNGK